MFAQVSAAQPILFKAGCFVVLEGCARSFEYGRESYLHAMAQPINRLRLTDRCLSSLLRETKNEQELEAALAQPPQPTTSSMVIIGSGKHRENAVGLHHATPKNDYNYDLKYSSRVHSLEQQ